MSDEQILKIYVLLSPWLVLLMALGVMGATNWRNAREDRRNGRHAAGE